MESKIRPIYEELLGYMAQAPDKEISVSGKTLADQLNQTIDELISITGEDKYIKFKVSIKPSSFGNEFKFFEIDEYRSNLNGLINRLHGLYFVKEALPFSGQIPMQVTNNVTQNQQVTTTVLLEIQSLLDKHLLENDIKPNERNFLDKLKQTLGSITDITTLISTIFKLAHDFGIDIKDLAKIFTE